MTGIVIVRLGQVRLEPQRRLELDFGVVVSPVERQRHCIRDVCFGELWSEGHGAGTGFLGQAQVGVARLPVSEEQGVGFGEPRVREREALVCLDRVAVHLERVVLAHAADLAGDVAGAQVGVQGAQIACGDMIQGRSLLRRRRGLQRGEDPVGDLTQHHEHFVVLPVDLLRPHDRPVRGGEQPRRDPQLASESGHAAFEHGGDAELAPEIGHGHLALEGGCRPARRDTERAHAGEYAVELRRQAVGEIVLLGVAARVGERRQGDRCGGRAGARGHAGLAFRPPLRRRGPRRASAALAIRSSMAPLGSNSVKPRVSFSS